ncbi:LPXTG-domain-containing protein cell wall anchor domain [Helcococcus kunzii ATCC 51366]|uniref:LPXTG-domain-containing protein cell wall anchor domain n=5 Tax=Helcococcus kunzii TaxID=40091 RepID=H3NQ15_9FIRM|nr:isopeptide-forming domain-containing fimbrial protein [Helcococcus kunzii]EHR32695.1 LPXTG-domain-containing protein cell wall anchor domain [Helcococcus kunzii ATCC 51366]
MKKTSKLLSLLLAFVMVFAFVAPVTKAASPTEPKTNKVVLHKLLMSESELSDWDPESITEEKYDGTQTIQELANNTGKDLKEIAGVYFAFQTEAGKWIDAEGKEVDSVDKALGGLTTATGLTLDTSKLPEGKYQIVEVTEKSTYVGENGETLTGQKAVPVMITLPMYNSDGLVEVAQVYPKNTEQKPQVDKDFKGLANAENPDATVSETRNYTIGESVPYEIQTIIPKDAKYATARWSDQMTEGLTFNNDVKVTLNGKDLTVKTDYTVTKSGNGFKLELTAEGLKKVNGQETAQTIQINYTATLNSATMVEVPESNDVIFNYGNNPDHGNAPIPTKPSNGEITATKTWAEGEAPEGVKVEFVLYNAQTGKEVARYTLQDGETSHKFTGLDNDTEYKVVETFNGYSAEYSTEGNGQIGVKNWKDNNPKPVNPEEPKVETFGKKFVKANDSNERLQGAQFVVQNKEDNKFLAPKTSEQTTQEQQALATAKTNLDEAVKGTDLAVIANAQEEYNKAFIAAKTSYVWVDTKEEALIITSNAQGQFEVTGLKEGEYQLVEIKAPEGYAKLQGPVAFSIAKGSYAQGDMAYVDGSGKTDAQKVINKKVTIPQTGGVGTLVFTIIGLVVMTGAGVVLVKNNKKETL